MEQSCLRLQKEKQGNLFFEASVGGGIPIIRPLYRCLMGERIEEITGILNGTTNYILTKMDKEGETFENALKEAQNLGYAERNPEADVEGHDTCRKIAILTSMATEDTAMPKIFIQKVLPKLQISILSMQRKWEPALSCLEPAASRMAR